MKINFNLLLPPEVSVGPGPLGIPTPLESSPLSSGKGGLGRPVVDGYPEVAVDGGYPALG